MRHVTFHHFRGKLMGSVEVPREAALVHVKGININNILRGSREKKVKRGDKK
jgi:hypothetical protein